MMYGKVFLLVAVLLGGVVPFVSFYYALSFLGVIGYVYVFYSHKIDVEKVKLLGIEKVIVVLFWPLFALFGVVKKFVVFLKYLVTDFPILLFEKSKSLSKSLLKWLFTRH